MNMNSGEYQKWLMERMYMTRSSPKHINKLKRPQTGVRVYKMKNYSSGTSPRKTYMFNNHAWTKCNQSLIKKPKIHKENSIDIKSDINKEQLNSVSQSESQVNSQSNKSHNRIWRITKQAQAHNSSQIYQLTSFQKKKLRKNFETIINAHNKDVVQYPFKGTYNPIEVVNNHTLFKRTRQKHSIGYHQSNDKVLLNNASKTIESSFGSNFPFFTNSDQKSVDYDSIYNPTQKSDRAKTPALNSINSQMIDPAYRASPKGILKKPHTAYGGRKRVTYSMIGHHKNAATDPKSEDPRGKEVRLSSYFKSCKSLPMMSLCDKSQKDAGINDKFKNKIMPKNCRYHLLFGK